LALGDTHSLIVTKSGRLLTSGSNHKYQLGLNPQERTLVIFNFKAIE
jgi:alpha-tubulin suppressor-like RCC1 family protein